MAIEYLQSQPSPCVLSYREACSVPCAGDLTAVFPCADERTNVVIGDVCGRDAPARAHAHYLRHLFRVLGEDRPPASLLESVNAAFYRRAALDEDNRFASVFVASVQGKVLTYASAGHEFALLAKESGRYCRLPPTGSILGLSARERYKEATLDVARGNWLVLVTDGITDARNAKGTFFGTSAVVRNALSAIQSGLDDPALWILEAARAHGRDRFVDDASVLCVRFA